VDLNKKFNVKFNNQTLGVYFDFLVGCLIETLTFCSSFKSFGSLTTINAGVGSGLKTMTNTP
jgi:hypothetical protein